MKKTSKVGRRAFNWESCSRACRSPETRAELSQEYKATGDLVGACTAIEDRLELRKGKLAKTERERIRDVRRIGEGA